MSRTRSTLMIFAALPVLVSPSVLSDTSGSFWANNTEFRHSMAQTGGSGLLRTPHAQTLGFGQISLNYHLEDNVDLTTGYSRGAHDTFLLGVGILPHVEFVVQNTHKEINGEAWKTGSDLSYSAKIDAAWLIPQDWFQLAFGLSDFGGQANHHESAYAVVSKQVSDFRFSMGYGYNPTDSRHQMGPDYLSGVFGGIEYQPFSWLQLVGDYDGTGMNAGAKLFTPQEWLPYGMSAHLTYQAYSDSNTLNRDNQWVGLGLTLPLSGPNAAPRYSRPQSHQEGVDQQEPTLNLRKASTVAQVSSEAEPVKAVAVNVEAEKTSSTHSLTRLTQRLTQYGFENVSVGTRQDELVVRLENNLFNVNEIDSLGVVLGLINEEMSQQRFAFVLLNNNLPVVKVSGTQQDLKQLFDKDNLTQIPASTNLTITTNQLYKALDDVNWNSNKQNSHLFKPRVIFSPSLYSTIGSEYGVFDYSLALATNVQVPVWTGAMVDVRHMLPISHSDDYADGERFGNSRHTSTVDRILLHQGVTLPAGVMAQISIGQVGTNYQGGTSEFRWQTEQGTHKFGFEASYYRDKRDQYDDNITPVLGSYRYYLSQYDWALEANAGQYWAGDKGFTVTSKHWFGDTSVNIYYQHTDKSFAGLSFSIPLTPRKDMAPAPIQIRGIEQWTYGYRTMVNNSSNDLNGSLAATSDLQHNLDRGYYNRDRLSASYIDANVVRLKDAYMTYAMQK
ncbi:YjbH domain-containing protein [Vibrio hangzhouensis]|uniref:Exopolysaccharide biosynthesis protein YbjH n=1 Tax=Vibrio hangzhouensis TaxID=462991 RepID=A0A1H6CAV4_9VIBR|nr:YjbH domain-containing protein [Vibrio hangzhouensis]SEG70119.1 Exopolysaccharide biosynthesis protein YbjH [Vibrio hangzhouensis]